jgi:NADPH-dependent 2,4-dienoyl-CoA reductase/sulfur reductase-like enzyme
MPAVPGTTGAAVRAGPPRRPLERVVVAGAGLAGLRACEGLRELGFDGSITLVGAEPHRPYDRPPLSKQFLAGAWDLDRVMLGGESLADDLGLDLLLGRSVRSLDLAARLLDVDGVELGFDGLVIATGAAPRALPGMPVGAEGLHLLRTIEDSVALREVLRQEGARVVVVGAGFIGSEVASTASGMGSQVTVVEALAVPLAGALGEEMGRACGELHAEGGVDLRLGVGVETVLTSGTGEEQRVTGARLSDGVVLEADAVVVGIGVAPATGWLEGSGLEVADGVVCDASLHAAPGVVAAGDVARWPYRPAGGDLRLEHWENAAGQGRHAAASLLAGTAAEPFEPVPYFWSDQYGVKIQFVGETQPGDEVVVVEGSVADRRFVACYGREGRLVAALAFHRPRLLMRYRSLLEGGASFAEALSSASG